jgi:hypothetical protein
MATPRGFHRRDTLVGLFWPEHDQELARNALSQAFISFADRSPRTLSLVAMATSWLWTRSALVPGHRVRCALDAGRSTEAVDLHRGDLGIR